MPGYHFHFITRDKKVGGHLLGYQAQNVKIEIDYTSEFFMTLPGGEGIYKLDLEVK
ncbi:MAG: acetolactate decarboxylase [Chloroflexi bacterium]|nr:acetolactate decarboxylase [Chloroflexota bacterium]